MEQSLVLEPEQYAAMLEQVRAASPEEACGILAGTAGVVTRVIPITNSLHSPVRYRMDAQEQLDALLWLEDNQQEMLAIYHSHPAGPPHPSATDIAEFAYPPALTLIWWPGEAGWLMRAFAIEGDHVREVRVQVGA